MPHPAMIEAKMLLQPQNWTFPIPIAYGPGRLSEIAGMCHAAGMARPLIATDRGSRALPFIARLKGLLTDGGLTTAAFSDISPNPRDDEIAVGCDTYRKDAHDGIIAAATDPGAWTTERTESLINRALTAAR